MTNDQRPMTNDHQSNAGKLERVATILLLVYFSDAFNSIGPLEKFFALLSYAIIFLLAIRQWKRIIYVSTKDIPLILLTGFAVISVLWSPVPEYTLENIRALIRITLFGAYLATRYSLKEQMYLVAWSLGIAALLSLTIGSVIPTGTDNYGRFQGTFSHKNILARNLVIGAISFLSLDVSRFKHRLVKWAGFILCLYLIILSTGKTALILLTLSLLFWPFRKAFKQPYKARVPLVVFALLMTGFASLVIAENLERIVVEGLGKDLSLTGRTELWDGIKIKVEERPWLGYGYFGFWASSEDDDLLYLVEHGWVPQHAHSGFWDLTLMLGISGLVLFMIHFLITYFRAIALATSDNSAESFWSFQFLTLMFLFNYSITISILSPVDINWALYISIAFSLAIQRRRLSGMYSRRLALPASVVAR
jgi:O-antigen ligase